MYINFKYLNYIFVQGIQFFSMIKNKAPKDCVIYAICKPSSEIKFNANKILENGQLFIYCEK